MIKKLRDALSKTRRVFLNALGLGVDEASLEELYDLLIMADVGVQATERIVNAVREQASKKDDLRGVIAGELRAILEDVDTSLREGDDITVYLFVGVNGTGKTTTIGKLAHSLKQRGKQVLLVGADTYRAGSFEQIEIWANRAGVDVVKGAPGGDPAAVVFDALDKALSKGYDYVLIDTAGRLHTRKDLMEELRKVYRVIERKLGRLPDEVLLVVDATQGQNVLSQAELFSSCTPLTGVALAKLDGTAKGGVVFALALRYNLGVKLVGCGEGLGDIVLFSPDEFIEDLLAEG